MGEAAVNGSAGSMNPESRFTGNSRTSKSGSSKSTSKLRSLIYGVCVRACSTDRVQTFLFTLRDTTRRCVRFIWFDEANSMNDHDHDDDDHDDRVGRVPACRKSFFRLRQCCSIFPFHSAVFLRAILAKVYRFLDIDQLRLPTHAFSTRFTKMYRFLASDRLGIQRNGDSDGYVGFIVDTRSF